MPGDNASERREHPRYNVELHSSVVLDGESHAARTRDVSRGGICLMLDRPVERGQRLPVQLSLALGTGPLSEPLELPGRVVWCTSLGDGHQLGLTFDELSYHQIGELEMFLRFLARQEVEESPEPAPSGFDVSDPQEESTDDGRPLGDLDQ